jgi:hypothetical protein
VELAHPDLSVRRQCELLGVNRAGLYYQPRGESKENLRLMRLLDEQYTRTPFYGRRRMPDPTRPVRPLVPLWLLEDLKPLGLRYDSDGRIDWESLRAITRSI